MDYVMITLRYQQQEADLELPTGVPLFNLVPIVMSQLSWPSNEKPEKFVGRIDGMVLRPYETLAQLEISHGAVMELVAVDDSMLVESSSDQSDSFLPLPADRGDAAYLLSRDTQETLAIRGRSTLIGRAPTCTINLSRFPNGDVVSSQHANMVRRSDGYWLTDEHSTNGTIVDGVLLQPGESMRLRQGSHIQFGETGPIFVFHQSSAAP